MNKQRASALLTELSARGLTVRRLVNDSRRVQPGDVFVAYPGAKVDGRLFINEVIQAGAVAVLVEAAGFDVPPCAVPLLPVLGLKALSGALAAELLGDPSSHLRLIGVTGTNGKTSITQWIANALAKVGQRCALIGTLGNGFPGALDESVNTTPDAFALQSLLSDFLNEGAVACAMEVSSIGLDQERCAASQFSTAVFTNLTRDHLDYHGTMQAYAAAKARLFVWPGLRSVVINIDDPFGLEMLASTSAVNKYVYSLAPALYVPIANAVLLQAKNIEDDSDGIYFDLLVDGRSYPVNAPVIGHYNVANLLALAGTLLAEGVSEAALPGLLGAVVSVPGRMQRLGGAGVPLVAVDYAHTPDALRNALNALRPSARQRGGNLVCIFGCGGDRDSGKRPLMGAVATQLADIVWLTSDNPRSEDPANILAEIAAGAGGGAWLEVDRRLAITQVIGQCTERDVVLLAGKGHETYQEIQGKKWPYSDELVVNAALALWRAEAAR